jgi:hypothetical protein
VRCGAASSGEQDGEGEGGKRHTNDTIRTEFQFVFSGGGAASKSYVFCCKNSLSPYKRRTHPKPIYGSNSYENEGS